MLTEQLDGGRPCALAATATGSLADAFVVGAAALAHVRADPLLPPSCADADWPGDALRAAYRAYQTAFSQRAARLVPRAVT